MKVGAGSLYHHFPDGKAELAAAVVGGVGDDVERLLRTCLASDASPAEIVGRWIDLLADGLEGDHRDRCPIEPIATESVHASQLVRTASARVFDGWCAARLTADGWSADSAMQTAQATIA